MLPASDDFSGGYDTGGSSGGGQGQPWPPVPVNFDNLLTIKLEEYRAQLSHELEQWFEHKPNQEALSALVKISSELFSAIYSRYRGRIEKDAKQAIALKELSDKVRLAIFGLRNMRDAGGNISPEDELRLHDFLLELDVAIELVLPAARDHRAPNQDLPAAPGQAGGLAGLRRVPELSRFARYMTNRAKSHC